MLGVTGAYYCAMTLNLVVAVIAFILNRHIRGTRAEDTRPKTSAGDSASSQALLPHHPEESYLFLIALGSGAAVLLLELVWARFASFFLGNRTYAFIMLMFAVLTLITLGALFPLTIALSRHCASDIGATSARYYGVNTVGVVVGSLGTGFIGLSILGSFGMLKLITGLLLLLALVSLQKAWRPLHLQLLASGLLLWLQLLRYRLRIPRDWQKVRVW
jgi:MFS family permease